MKILNYHTIDGPNLYHHEPILIAEIDLERHIESESSSIPGFVDRLLAAVPGISAHRCSLGTPGGFIERLRLGTYFAHIIEHVALELSGAAGIEVGYGKARATHRPGVYRVIIRSRNDAGMRYLTETSMLLVEAIAEGQNFDLQSRLIEARRLIARTRLGPSTQAIVDAAQRRGIPWQRIGSGSLVQLGWGKNLRRIQAAVTNPSTGRISIDPIGTDISSPIPARGAGVVEVNAGPGIRIHPYPTQGQPRDAGAAIVDSIFPPGQDGRIPTVAITGTNGKTTVTRMISHLLERSGVRVGMTTTDGIWIGGKNVASGDTTAPASASTVLMDPSVEAAVLETARGEIVRRGLGYDWTDVAVITNIQPDHLGQDGIETLEDILDAKSLVAERVRAGGTLVLNADDEALVRLADNPRIRQVQREIAFFSANGGPENHLILRRHIATGGRAYFLREGVIIEGSPSGNRPVISVSAIPVTLGSAAQHQVMNALAAVAASRALGMAPEQIAIGLRDFNAERNPGRLSFYRLASGAHVLLDCGHTPGAFRAMGRLSRSLQGYRVTAVAGVPGDRSNELIGECGRALAESFPMLILNEDADLRGRAPGEVAEILLAEVCRAPRRGEVEVRLREADAVRRALTDAGPSDLVIVFFDDRSVVHELLREFYAHIVSAPPANRQYRMSERVEARSTSGQASRAEPTCGMSA